MAAMPARVSPASEESGRGPTGHATLRAPPLAPAEAGGLNAGASRVSTARLEGRNGLRLFTRVRDSEGLCLARLSEPDLLFCSNVNFESSPLWVLKKIIGIEGSGIAAHPSR
jgi:hypothetical protein